MSRTYRLKNTHEYGFHLTVWEWKTSKYGGKYMSSREIQPHEEEYRKGKAKQHKDGQGRGVPHWYTNLYFERSFRRNAKNELKKFVSNFKSINYEEQDVVLEKFRHGIGYEYF